MTKQKEIKEEKKEVKTYPDNKFRWHLCRYELNQIAWMGCKNPRNMAKKKEKQK